MAKRSPLDHARLSSMLSAYAAAHSTSTHVLAVLIFDPTFVDTNSYTDTSLTPCYVENEDGTLDVFDPIDLPLPPAHAKPYEIVENYYNNNITVMRNWGIGPIYLTPRQ